MKRIFAPFILMLLVLVLVSCSNAKTSEGNVTEDEAEQNENIEDEDNENEVNDNEQEAVTANITINEITVEGKSAEDVAGLDEDIRFAITKLLKGEMDDAFYAFISDRDKELVTEEFEFKTEDELKERYVELFTPLSKDLQQLVKQNGDIIELDSVSSLIGQTGNDSNNLSLQLDMVMIFENDHEEEVGFVFDISGDEQFEYNTMFLYNEMD